MSIIHEALKRLQNMKAKNQPDDREFGMNLPWLSAWYKKRFTTKRIILFTGLIISIMVFIFYRPSVFKRQVSVAKPERKASNSNQVSVPKPVRKASDGNIVFRHAINSIFAQTKHGRKASNGNIVFRLLDEELEDIIPSRKPEEKTSQPPDTAQNVSASSYTEEKGGITFNIIDEGSHDLPAAKETSATDSPSPAPAPNDNQTALSRKKEEPAEESTKTAAVSEPQTPPAASPQEPAEKQASTQTIISTSEEAIDHLNLAILYQKENKLDEALEEYKQAIELDPLNAQSYNNMGMVFYNRGNLSEAIIQYQKALSINSGYDKAHHNLAVAYYHQGDYDRAALEFTLAISCNPRNPESYNNLGVLYRKQNNLSLAKHVLQQGITTASMKYPPLYYTLALILEDEGDERAAVFYYKKFIELSADDQQELVEKVKRHLSVISSYTKQERSKNEENQIQ